MKDLIWPFGHAKDIGYILWPLAAMSIVGLGSMLIVLSLAWPR